MNLLRHQLGIANLYLTRSSLIHHRWWFLSDQIPQVEEPILASGAYIASKVVRVAEIAKLVLGRESRQTGLRFCLFSKLCSSYRKPQGTPDTQPIHMPAATSIWYGSHLRSCFHRLHHKSVYLQDDHQGVLGGAEKVHGGDELIVGDQHHPEDKERSILKDHIDQDGPNIQVAADFLCFFTAWSPAGQSFLWCRSDDGKLQERRWPGTHDCRGSSAGLLGYNLASCVSLANTPAPSQRCSVCSPDRGFAWSGLLSAQFCGLHYTARMPGCAAWGRYGIAYTRAAHCPPASHTAFTSLWPAARPGTVVCTQLAALYTAPWLPTSAFTQVLQCGRTLTQPQQPG